MITDCRNCTGGSEFKTVHSNYGTVTTDSEEGVKHRANVQVYEVFDVRSVLTPDTTSVLTFIVQFAGVV